MTHKTSGMLLREERERQGFDINVVGRRLRIRSDILRSIESGDFSNIPPRGYARNMVNAYARFLGLNPSDIVNRFLEEAYADQLDRGARRNFPGRRGESLYSTAQSVRGANQAPNPRYEHRFASSGVASASIPKRRSPLGRDLYDDRTRFARGDYGLYGSSRRVAPVEGDDRRDVGAYQKSEMGQSFLSEAPSRWPHKRHGRSIKTPTPFSFSNLSGLSDGIKRLNWPLLLGVIALVVVVIIVVSLFFGRSRPRTDDLAAIPITGIADTTSQEDEQSAPELSQAATTPRVPTSITITYGVATVDATSKVTITEDKKKLKPETLKGPVSKDVELTSGSWTIETPSPINLKLTVDGKPVSLKSSKSGVYSYTVNFDEYIKQWKKDHGLSDSSDSSASDGSTSSASNTRGDTQTSTKQQDSSKKSQSQATQQSSTKQQQSRSKQPQTTKKQTSSSAHTNSRERSQ